MRPNLRLNVERLLHTVTGCSVSIMDSEGLGGEFAQVERLHFDHECPGVGRTVLAKTRRTGGTGWGFDPANLRREYAALRTISSLGVDTAARVIAVDDGTGVLVLRDLGAGPSVEHLLSIDDPVVAELALMGMAETLAAMHVGAYGSETLFDRHYAAVSVGERPRDQVIAGLDNLLAKWTQAREAFEERGFSSSDMAALDTDLAAFDSALGDTRFQTMTHTDLMPHNAIVVGAGVCLVDFEGAGYRHLGIDAATMRYPFQNHDRTLPPSVRAAMERVYRNGLAASPWDNDNTYDELMAIGCVHAAIRECCGIRRVDDPGLTHDKARHRQTRFAQLVSVAIEALQHADRLPTLGTWLNYMLDEMRARWPALDAAPAIFPAFVGE